MDADYMESLHFAFKSGNERKLTKLLQSGKCIWEQFPLSSYESFFRFVVRNSKFVELLLIDGAPVTVRTIEYAIIGGELKSLELLLKYATDEVKRNCLTVLDDCACNKNDNSKYIFELLMKHGYDKDVNRKENPSLMNAIFWSNIKVVEKLLIYGANPCMEHNSMMGSSALEVAFLCELPVTTKEIVKYAVLHSDFQDNKQKKEFFQNFRVEIAKFYMKFAESCVAEAMSLKVLYLNSNKLTLFDYITSQGEKFKLLLNDVNITNRLLCLLSFTSLPIYKIEILRKVGKNFILRSIPKLSGMNCFVGIKKKVHLGSDSILYICKFLSSEDIFSLWMAITVI